MRPQTAILRTVSSWHVGYVWLLIWLLIAFAGPSVRAGDPLAEETERYFGTAGLPAQWVWETNTFDKQTCRLWKSFEIPAGSKLAKATLRITTDDGYLLFLDGREIGRGSDWRSITEYDVTHLLDSGKHILAVEGFNDRDLAGVILRLHIELMGGYTLDVISDPSWMVVTDPVRHWNNRKSALPNWHPATVINWANPHPEQRWPYRLATEPPLEPAIVRCWQTGWFQLGLFLICAAALFSCLWLWLQLTAQSRAQKFLKVERARIARDIHDDLGAQLTQLLLLGEVAQREQPESSPARGQFNEICAGARTLAHALDEVVWTVNSKRDTVRDFISHVCKYAQIFLNPTNIRCRLDVDTEIPTVELELPVRRNLFLAVKEALNNAAKYSQAQELFLRIHRRDDKLVVMVDDDGTGFDLENTADERNGLTNMAQRMTEIGGTCEMFSQPGAGCRLMFTVPLPSPRRNWWLRRTPETEEE